MDIRRMVVSSWQRLNSQRRWIKFPASQTTARSMEADQSPKRRMEKADPSDST